MRQRAFGCCTVRLFYFAAGDNIDAIVVGGGRLDMEFNSIVSRADAEPCHAGLMSATWDTRDSQYNPHAINYQYRPAQKKN